MRTRRLTSANPPLAECVRHVKFDHWEVELLPRAPYEVCYTPAHSIIGFSFEAQEGVHSFASDDRKKFYAIPNGLAWVPAGCDVYSQSMGGEYLKISCSRNSSIAFSAAPHFSDYVNQSAIESAYALRRALLSNSDIDVLAYEHWVMQLVLCVNNALVCSNKPEQLGRWMSTQRLRRIDELIDARLDCQLTVSAIASELGISAGFLSREFGRAVGRSPHQYIIDKRLARARLSLLQPNLDLSGIALQCGFSSHSHMTSQFRARFGLTPSQLRAEA